MNDASAPTQFSWRLTLGEGQLLTTLADGRVAVINSRPAPVPGVRLSLLDLGIDVVEPGSQAPTAHDAVARAQTVGDTGAKLAETTKVFDEAQPQTRGEVVLVFPAPWALDAGQPVPVTLSAVGDVVTMTVDRGETDAFPVVASPAPTASAAAAGGPMRSLTFNIRGATPKGGDPQAEKGGSREEFETHDRLVASVIFNQLGATNTRGYVPGVAGLQEVCGNDFVKILNDRDDQGQWTGEFQRLTRATDCLDGDDFGNAILRNVPLVTGGSLVATQRVAYIVQPGERRGYIRDRLNIRGRSVFTFNTHLTPSGPLAFKQLQVSQLSEAAEQRSDVPRLVMGDLNLSFQKTKERVILNRFFYNRGYGEVDSDRDAPTFPSGPGDPQDKLDYIFYSKAQTSLNGGSVKPIDTDDDPPCAELPCTSDHRPLVGSTTVTG